MRRFRIGCFGAAISALVIGSPSLAQAVAVGRITSIQSCTYFRNSEGLTAGEFSPWYASFLSYWRSWWSKDCVDEFPTIRQSVEAALASSGKFAIGPGGYRVDLSLSNLNEGGPAPSTRPVGSDGYAISRAWASVGFDVTVRGPGGEIQYGGPFIKKIETGYDIRGGGERAWGETTDAAAMALLQQQISLALARFVAFKIEPLKVSRVDQGDVELNYGSPLLSVGDTISVGHGDGLRGLRFKVVSTSDRSAVAEIDGDFDSEVRVGASASFIENDSEAANARRFRRVRLP